MMKNNEKRHLYDAFIFNKKPLGVYIHIPFCERRCYYCDFLSSTAYSRVDSYFTDLLNEIDLYHKAYGSLDIDSIYFGGGTPSSVNGTYIKDVLEALGRLNNIDINSEITIELNPESVSRSKLDIYKKAGVNRVSMGCQSFDDEKLKQIGRLHDSQRIFVAYNMLKEAGFSNINLDLIFALPGQSYQDFDRDIEKLLNLDPTHISAYSLILEEDTKLYQMVRAKDLVLMEDEADRSYYHRLIGALESKGYTHYEISNFSKPNMESRHNLKYWNLEPYIGLGLGASSFFDGKRYMTYDDFDLYHESIAKGQLAWTNIENMNYESLKKDYILMKLRLRKGIARKEYKQIFGEDFYEEYKDLIDRFVGDKNIVVTDENVYFTIKGVDISNRFYIEII